MPDAPALPELARSLRALGTQRDAAAAASHAAIFLPLLEARARAAGATLDVVLATLRGDALSARIEAGAVDAAVLGVDQPARVRALTAQTSELMEPLRRELLSLDTMAEAAHLGQSGWSRWVEQLRCVFVSADVACNALSGLLRNRPAPAQKSHWFARPLK